MKKAIVLVEHARAAQHVFEDIRKLGYSVFYIGKDKVLQQSSDEYLDLNTLTELESWIEEGRIDIASLDIAGVLTFSEDQKFVERRLCEHLGFPTLDINVLLACRDKNLMRKRMKAAGLETPQFYFIPDSQVSAEPPFAFPFIMKPNYGFSSAGVQLVRTNDEFQSALRTIRRINRFALKKMAYAEIGTVCEQYINGPEYSVDSITVDGVTRVFTVCERGFPADENFQDYVYATPPELKATEFARLEFAVKDMLSALNFNRGPAHTELRYDTENDKWVVLETAFRVGFSGNIGAACRASTGIAYNQLAIRALIGDLSVDELNEVKGTFSRPTVLFTPATGSGGIVKSFKGEAQLKSDARIDSYYLTKSSGEMVVPYPKGIEYLGYILATADDRSGLDILTKQLAREMVYEYEN